MFGDINVESPLHYLHKLSSHYTGDREGDIFNAEAEYAVVVKERRGCAFLNLRGSAEDKLFCAAVANVLGIELPTTPGHYHSNDDSCIYWLGPDEWLLVSSSQEAGDLEIQLRADMAGHISVVDVSGGYTSINLRGVAHALDTLLKKSCVYDVAGWPDASSRTGRCAQTTFAKASAVVSNKFDGSYEIIIRRSFADYLGRWLLDAGEEFGCRIEG